MSRYLPNTKHLSLFVLPALILLGVLFLSPTKVYAASLTVDSILDTSDTSAGDGSCDDGSGNCTLRAAIEEANALAGADTINFNISGSGVHTLTPASAYDDITESVTIDGYSQPGSVANTAVSPNPFNGTLTIELDGTGAGFSNGFKITVADVTIKGLNIHNFGLDGIQSDGVNTSIYGNYLTNNGVGIILSSLADNSVIGSTNPANRNVISGNSEDGIKLPSGNNGSTIVGNYIGVAADGTTGFANANNGITADSSNTTIGGVTLGATNIISANGNIGIQLGGVSVTIQGNYIGLDSTGVTLLGNGGMGIGANNGSGNLIGGTTAESRNIIAGNNSQLVFFNTNNNTVQGNYIGTDKNGGSVTNPTPAVGIGIYNNSNNNLIGGVVNGSGNKIAFNTLNGVLLLYIEGFGSNPLNNSFIGNDIEQNTGSAIRLCNDTNTDFQCDTPEPYPNDSGDTDEGPNMFMNFPVINSATKGNGQVTVNYDLDINPAEVGATGYSVDFYANSTNAREGAIYLGSDVVPGSVTGQSATLTLPVSVPADYYVTAVTTMTDVSSDGYGHSSEFSAPVQAIVSNSTTNNGSTSSSSLAETGQNTNPLILLSSILLTSGLALATYTYNKQRRKNV